MKFVTKEPIVELSLTHCGRAIAKAVSAQCFATLRPLPSQSPSLGPQNAFNELIKWKMHLKLHNCCGISFVCGVVGHNYTNWIDSCLTGTPEWCSPFAVWFDMSWIELIYKINGRFEILITERKSEWKAAKIHICRSFLQTNSYSLEENTTQNILSLSALLANVGSDSLLDIAVDYWLTNKVCVWIKFLKPTDREWLPLQEWALVLEFCS